MKTLSNICLIGGLAVFCVGIVSKYVTQIGAIQPASYLLAMQVLVLLSINFAIYELLNKK